jgi:hypothetical protein
MKSALNKPKVQAHIFSSVDWTFAEEFSPIERGAFKTWSEPTSTLPMQELAEARCQRREV